MRERVDGVRRASIAKHHGLGPHAKIPRLESLQAQSWTLRTSSHTAVRLLCELAIDPFLNDGWTSA